MFSRLLPTARGRSFYEELRDQDDAERGRAGLLDEENLNHNFHDYDLENAEGLGVDDSQPGLGEVAAARGRQPGARTRRTSGLGWPIHDDDGDNDVPASLLVEHNDHTSGTPGQHNRRTGNHRTPAIPGSSRARPQWEATQAQQRLHRDDSFPPFGRIRDAPTSFMTGVISGSAKKKAEWRWANVSNLDKFIQDVYDYYVGCGIWCILLERVLHLLLVLLLKHDTED